MFRKRRRFFKRRRGRANRWRRWRAHRYGNYFRRRRRVRPHLVTEWLPGRHRNLWVRGWEPLANLCHGGTYAKTRAEPYKSVEPQGGGQGQWTGTWGAHYFTLQNLLFRAKAYWNQFSEDWSSFDYIKFAGGTIYIPQTAPTTWMINTDEYLQVKLIDYDPTNKEDQWVHPGILLNNPKTHIIFPPSVYRKRKFYRIKIKPPPGWKGFQRLPTASTYICFHWAWTWCNLNQAFFDPNYTQDTSKCEQQPWWAANNFLSKWVNRQKYSNCSSQTIDKSGGPFLPCKYSQQECSLFFLYKLKFKAVGNSLWRQVPRNLSNGDLVPAAPGPTDVGASTSRKTKRSRPIDLYDIWPGDLDSHGLIKRRAFERITGLGTRDKRRRLQDQDRRLKHLAAKLTDILANRNLLRGGGGGGLGDNPPYPPLKGGEK
nr:ORF1 [Torque teno felis virus]